MAFRSTRQRLCTVLIQPMHYASDPARDVPGFRKAGKAYAGGQLGTASSPASTRPFVYDGPVNIPYWHHVADIWRPRPVEQSFPGQHEQTFDGSCKLTPELIAVRPILADIYRHRNLPNGPEVAMTRWEGVKKGHEAGIFNDDCLHRAGFHVLDVLAEHKDTEGAELIYAEMHDPKETTGLKLPLNAGHTEKMVYLGYDSDNHQFALRYFEEAMACGMSPLLKTQTWACAMASYGRELEAAKGIDCWNKWLFLARDVHSFPYYQLSELAMGCVEDLEQADLKLVLRCFNDFYLEKVWQACRANGMENDQVVYYAEWLYKARRHVMLNPFTNYHFMQYAMKRIKS
ncbi:hypothetical protein DIPPA_32001 [Diplonema papillatum]|nr:hypothetical protein DIPPA_32001 [Diplonema papillatum]